MTLYLGDTIGVEIRLDTNSTLTDATLISIVGTTPGGTAINWTATQYGTTDQITYTTVDGDLDEVGTYLIRAYIEWGASSKHYGEITEIEVVDIDERVTSVAVVKYVNAFTFLNCQTEDESLAGTNTDADILFDGQSFNQGNFTIFYKMATEQLTEDVSKYVITLTYTQEMRALSYLIQHYWEQKFKDWDAKETSINNDIVVKGVGGTSGYAAYIKLIKEVRNAGSSNIINTTIVNHADHDNYPDDFISEPFTPIDLDVV